MKQIKDIVNRPKEKSKITNQRQEIIKMFVERLNQDIEVTNINARKLGQKTYPLRTPAYIAIRLSHLSEADLWYFLSVCKQAPHFSKKFWWELKNR